MPSPPSRTSLNARRRPIGHRCTRMKLGGLMAVSDLCESVCICGSRLLPAQRLRFETEHSPSASSYLRAVAPSRFKIFCVWWIARGPVGPSVACSGRRCPSIRSGSSPRSELPRQSCRSWGTVPRWAGYTLVISEWNASFHKDRWGLHGIRHRDLLAQRSRRRMGIIETRDAAPSVTTGDRGLPNASVGRQSGSSELPSDAGLDEIAL
jgi:hypothetical protein